MRGCVAGAFAPLQGADALALQGHSLTRNSIYFFAFRLDGARSRSRTSLRASDPGGDSARLRRSRQRTVLPSLDGESISAGLRRDGQPAEASPGKIRSDS